MTSLNSCDFSIMMKWETFPETDNPHSLSDEKQTPARKKLGGNFIARHARSA